MAIIQMPSGLLLKRLSMGQKRYDLASDSSDTGNSSTRLLAPPRWTMTFTSDDRMDTLQATAWEALALQLRGRVNTLEAWDYGKPAPLGTLRGSITLSAAHAAGATTLNLVAAGQVGKTLLAGDWLRLGTGLGSSQLVKVVVGGTTNGSGAVTVTVEPPLRYAFSSGVSVTWDKPTTFYKQVQQTGGWAYEGATQGGFSFDLIETWN